MMGERGGNRRKNVVVESRGSKGEERRVDLGGEGGFASVIMGERGGKQEEKNS